MRFLIGLSVALMIATPPLAAAAKPKNTPALAPKPGPSDWRPVDPENTLVIDTNQGRIIAELAPLLAPNHLARIKALTVSISMMVRPFSA